MKSSGKKNFLLLQLTFFAAFFLQTDRIQAQELPHYPDSLFSTYYHQKVTQFRLLPHKEDEIVFLGNSITDGGLWSELFEDSTIINRGISGDNTTGVLNRLDDIVNRKPKKVFLLIGTNDLAQGADKDTVIDNIEKIIQLIQVHSPSTRVFVQSIFPVSKNSKFSGHAKKRREIASINEHLKENAEKLKYTYINVFDVLKKDEDELNPDYSNDGLHLTGPGYMAWKDKVFPYVFDLNEKASVLPKPQKMEWKSGKFPLYLHPDIIVKEELQEEAETLQEVLKFYGIRSDIKSTSNENHPYIALKLGKVDAPVQQEEAYQLTVDDHKIELTANSAHGIFNGIQSLRQLMRNGAFVDGVKIRDWPAFAYRGYMIDVGRNYQSMRQIKEQIDVLAEHKMNVFHFHPTEDIAWRIQIDRYPELTQAEFMTRDKGLYYTIDQMKELIAYAKKRHIEFVLEIDMPGHSEAFKKAMGVDMQTEKGVRIVKNILKEVAQTYPDLKKIHIGADEVEITNENFVPEMVDLLDSLGLQSIGWSPGGNYDERTIEQLWMSIGPEQPEDGKIIRYIDSRDLYTNHMDPLNGVVSIFNRKIGDVAQGNESILGGEIAIWNDNRMRTEEDFLQMNFAYPAILAFAERSWQGGGHDGFLTDLGKKGSQRYKDFVDFEKRLIDQKKRYFKERSFPYQSQAHAEWKLFGAFDNKGDLNASFWPEKDLEKVKNTTADLNLFGGTVWLRHFFTPLVSGFLEEPKENTTWYAYREIYSSEDKEAAFWIGFDNPSRSYVVSTPKEGKWDNRESKVWVNGEEIAPPKWTYRGREGTTEDPMVDEGYEYRSPTKIQLKKGWNRVLIKAPVGSFAKRSWQHPVKWMFTFIEVED